MVNIDPSSAPAALAVLIGFGLVLLIALWGGKK